MERHPTAVAQKTARFEKWPRESLLLFTRLKTKKENKNTTQKTERYVRLLERFLKTEDKDRKMEDIPGIKLNEYISQFIISVRIKDGNEY